MTEELSLGYSTCLPTEARLGMSAGKTRRPVHWTIGTSQESSSTPRPKSINSLVLSFLYSSTLTSIDDYWNAVRDSGQEEEGMTEDEMAG